MAASVNDDLSAMPVIRDPKDFDLKSGNVLERTIFNFRPLMLVICVVMSLFLGWHASQLTVNAAFERLIPQDHPYIQNYLKNRDDLRSLGNTLRIVVENTQGDIFDAEYLNVVKDITDTMYLMPGADRPWVKSVWMAAVRYLIVNEEGYAGGPVMPAGMDGSPGKMAEFRTNVFRAGIVGSYVANDLKSSMVVVPLLEKYPDTGKPLDYKAVGRFLEEKIRSKETAKVKIHIVGFAKLVGDLIDGLGEIFGFFLISAGIATVVVYLYTRDLRSTVMLVTVSILGVVWMLGLMHLLGYDLDPYSVLVPFLVFAIGLSHGAQKMNGIMQDIGRGTHKYVAARYTFRRLFVAGLTALLANVVGFAVLMVIDIPVIRNLALTTSIGVSVLIFTKLILIPVLLSYIGVSEAVAQRTVRREGSQSTVFTHLWNFLVMHTQRGYAIFAISLAALVFGVAFMVSRHVQIGDLDAGAPELRPDSRYNRDVDYIGQHYGLTSDQFAIIMQTPNGGETCVDYPTTIEMDRLEWQLRRTPGVIGTVSFTDVLRQLTQVFNEDWNKWNTLLREYASMQMQIAQGGEAYIDLTNRDCKISPIIAYLSDHKAATLERVLSTVEKFGAEHNTDERRFLPAAGAAGIEAVTNIVVEQSNIKMHIVVYASVVLLCFITFRSWRAVIVAVLPLVITSFLCEALMVWLNIGIKVATLPVIALGVGVGVDYALYLLSIQVNLQRKGETLANAYKRSLDFTGKIVALVGLTMAAGVCTWAFSPIKFQADMGILLTFMFLWNMIGALALIPALSHFLLRKTG